MAEKPKFRVTCHTPDGADPYRRIDGLGGTENGGWWGDEDTLISEMEAGKYSLWTTTPEGKSVWVLIRQRDGRKFLTTEADGLAPNNLLNLPACSA